MQNCDPYERHFTDGRNPAERQRSNLGVFSTVVFALAFIGVAIGFVFSGQRGAFLAALISVGFFILFLWVAALSLDRYDLVIDDTGIGKYKRNRICKTTAVRLSYRVLAASSSYAIS